MKKLFTIKNMAIIAIMSAIAGILMFIDFPISFIAPAFYKLDVSDLPCLIVSFLLGPLAGSITEILKVLIKLLLKPTSSAFVGEISNIICGLSLCIPAAIIYNKNHDRKGAIKALVIGSITLVVVGSFMNYIFIIPSYVKIYKMPLDAIINAGKAIFPIIKDKLTFVLLCTAPFNLIKAILVSILTYTLYKRISHIFNKI